eukprot:scaffold90993_cov82-Phaeocystis_antarctica.AAC.1
MQPCTADSGRSASVTKLATLASGGRARRRPRADDEETEAAAEHMQPCTAHTGGSASVTKLATLASGGRARRRP